MSFVGDLVGSVIGGNSASKANRQQQQATDAAIGENRRQYDLTRQDYAPYREAGYKALSQYQNELGRPITAADVMSDPGYQFGLSQGQQALDRKASAMGGRVSGAALKAAARYGSDYASNGYNAAYQRGQDRLNRIAALANVGQTATNSVSSAGQQSTNAISNLISNQGNANAAATVAKGNIWGNFAQSAIPAALSYFSDERMKTNIVPIGKTAKGNTWYRWDWKTGGSGEGVIAQEVAHIPGAVSRDADGMMMVDYTKV